MSLYDQLRQLRVTDEAQIQKKRSNIGWQAVTQLRALADATIDKMKSNGYMHRDTPADSSRRDPDCVHCTAVVGWGTDFVGVHYEGYVQAAWSVCRWAKYDLPRGVLRYEVFLLESKQFVSVRCFGGGRHLVEEYDPDRYGDSDENLMNITVATTKLTHDQYFEKEWSAFIS